MPNCELCGPPNKRGNDPLDEVTGTDHRLSDNLKKNHNNTEQDASKIDCPAWCKEQKDYWKKRIG